MLPLYDMRHLLLHETPIVSIHEVPWRSKPRDEGWGVACKAKYLSNNNGAVPFVLFASFTPNLLLPLRGALMGIQFLLFFQSAKNTISVALSKTLDLSLLAQRQSVWDWGSRGQLPPLSECLCVWLDPPLSLDNMLPMFWLMEDF